MPQVSSSEPWASAAQGRHVKPNRLRLKQVGKCRLLFGTSSYPFREASFTSPLSLRLCAIIMTLEEPGSATAITLLPMPFLTAFLSLDCVPGKEKHFPQADVCLRGDTQHLNYQGRFQTVQDQVLAAELWGGPVPSLCTSQQGSSRFPTTVSAGPQQISSPGLHHYHIIPLLPNPITTSLSWAKEKTEL